MTSKLFASFLFTIPTHTQFVDANFSNITKTLSVIEILLMAADIFPLSLAFPAIEFHFPGVSLIAKRSSPPAIN